MHKIITPILCKLLCKKQLTSRENCDIIPVETKKGETKMKDEFWVIIYGLYDEILYDGHDFHEAVEAVDMGLYEWGAPAVSFWYNKKEIILKR